jgi:hypothetical protein
MHIMFIIYSIKSSSNRVSAKDLWGPWNTPLGKICIGSSVEMAMV